MNDQLTTLLEIQDMRSKAREMREGELDLIEEEHFQVNVEEACAALDQRIEELVEELAEPIRRQYRRIEKGRSRVVVPVIDGVCYGCFVSISTSAATDEGINQSVVTCETCGRFLYITPEEAG